jgi:hypothetical protein
LCNRLPQRSGVHEVRETASAVDLHDRDPFAVLRLELGVAVDRDLAQVEPELLVRSADNPTCRLAEVTAGSGVENDLGYG